MNRREFFAGVPVLAMVGTTFPAEVARATGGVALVEKGHRLHGGTVIFNDEDVEMCRRNGMDIRELIRAKCQNLELSMLEYAAEEKWI